jgi:hypothetical protein
LFLSYPIIIPYTLASVNLRKLSIDNDPSFKLSLSLNHPLSPLVAAVHHQQGALKAF